MVGCGILSETARGESFAGWEGLRVVEQDGYPARMRSADLDQNGGDELIVVNFRNARLDVYSWKKAAKQSPNASDLNAASAPNMGHVNDLPMARELQLTEIPVRQPPLDVAVIPASTNGDRSARLLVLVADPNLLLEFAPDANGAWVVSRQWDLLAGRATGIDRLLHVIPDAQDGSIKVLVSFNEGIQTLTIGPESSSAKPASARWLEPRETVGRIDWWVADLDGNGHGDLVEWTNNTAQSLRWYAASPEGYRPAQTLHDRAVNMVSVLERPDGGDELLVLESSPEGVVRRYRLGQGEASALGKQEPLTLPGGENAVWATLAIEGQPHLVVADPNQPRVTLYAHGASGWSPGESYPVSGKIKAMFELPAQPGSLVLWPEGSGDLYQSYWDGGRLTFPQPMGLNQEIEESQVLGLGFGVSHAWCIQKADDDLLLHRINDLPNRVVGISESSASGIDTIRFSNAAGKAERAIVLGGQRLLVTDKFTKGLRLVRLLDQESGEAESSTPSRLSKATLDEFKLFLTSNEQDGEVARVGWQTDGVVQWLGDDLHAEDQVMLPDGRRIADLVLNKDGSAWALQQGGGAIHRLTPDDAGVLRVDSTTRLDGKGRSLVQNDDLGLLMQTTDGITRLAEGQPRELEVVQSLDARAGRPEGVRDATVHRVMSVDLDGDGHDDALLADDVRHQLTAMSMSGEGQLTPMMSWPVFEDIAYPYGGGGDNQVREPRSVVALDLDGDGGQDLALLSHDRLLIYLARDSQPSTEAKP